MNPMTGFLREKVASFTGNGVYDGAPKEALINSPKSVIAPGGHKHAEGINERSAAISQFIISRLEIASLAKGILSGTAFRVYAL
jgi:hypothetical protein